MTKNNTSLIWLSLVLIFDFTIPNTYLFGQNQKIYKAKIFANVDMPLKSIIMLEI